MQNSTLFSVLIANFNNGQYLVESVDSVFNQSYTNWEIIIVDDNSTDISKEVYKKYEHDERIKIFFNDKNYGCGYTKRRCVEYANGEICGFLDPDDRLESHALTIMVKTHKENPNVSIITSKYYLIDTKNHVKSKGTQGGPIPEGESYLTFGWGALTHFATFKLNYYKKTKGIDSKFKRAVDQDLYLKMEEVGDVLFINDYLYNYNINDNSISANNNVYKARYWHMIAMKDAYNRRRKNQSIKNLTKNQVTEMVFEHKISRISRTRKVMSKFYFHISAFFIDPYQYSILCLKKFLR